MVITPSGKLLTGGGLTDGSVYFRAEPTAQGVGWYSFESNNPVRGTARTELTNSASILWFGYPQSAGGSFRNLATVGYSTESFGLGYSNTNTIKAHCAVNGSDTTVGNLSAAANIFVGAAAVHDGATCKLYSISGEEASTASTWVAPTMDVFNIASSSWRFGATAITILALCYKRALSPGEVREVLRNPWQLFQPLPRRVFVGPSAGGETGVGTASFSFAATGTGASTAASAGSATVTFAATGTGTGTFATSGSATVTFTPSAVGTAVSQGAGTATLTFTVTGEGASTTSGEGVGTADVTFAASAVGTSTAAAAGTATVTFNASGVGPTVSTGVGTASFAFDATAYSPTVATGVGSTTFTFSAFGSSVDFRYPAIVELTDAHVTKLALNDLPLTLVELTDSATYKVTLSDIGNVS